MDGRCAGVILPSRPGDIFRPTRPTQTVSADLAVARHVLAPAVCALLRYGRRPVARPNVGAAHDSPRLGVGRRPPYGQLGTATATCTWPLSSSPARGQACRVQGELQQDAHSVWAG